MIAVATFSPGLASHCGCIRSEMPACGTVNGPAGPLSLHSGPVPLMLWIWAGSQISSARVPGLPSQ